MEKNDLIISSHDNKRIKEIKSLYETSGIIKNKRIVISGEKIVNEVINEGLIEKPEVYIPDNCDNFGFDIKSLKNNQKILVKKELFGEIDQFNTGYPIVVSELPEMKNWNYSTISGCTLLLPFQNPINIGSSIRSAVALGVKKIVVLKDAAHPFHPKSIRSSSGSVFRVEIAMGPTLSELFIRHKDIKNLISLDMSGQNVTKFSFPDSFVLLPGSEGQGLPNKLRNNSVSIPMASGVESLNASVSVSLVLWEWRRRFS